MELPILEGYKDLEISYCRNCGGFLYKGKYIPLQDFKKAFPKIIKGHLSFTVSPKKVTVDDSVLDNIEKKKNVPIRVAADIEGEEVEEEAVMEVTFKRVECPFCARLKGGYYEGILQLRNENNSRFLDIQKKIRDRTDENNMVAISMEKDVKGGTDFYMTDKKYIQNLSSELHNEHGGELKESPRLYSFDRQSSKRVYRVNVLYRLPDLEAGDIIEWKDNYYKVNSISGDKVTAESLTDRKKRPIKISETEKIKDKNDYKEVIVTKTRPQVEVLHPESYTSSTLQNQLSEDKEKINVVELAEGLYAV